MSNFEEKNPADISIEEIYPIIHKFFPNLSKEQIKFHYHGSYNVFIVKNRYIFRFPDRAFRNELGRKMIHKEEILLDKIRSYLPCTIPKPLYFTTDSQVPYVGYEMIPGVSLSRCIQTFTADQLSDIAIQIGKVLSHLHSQALRQEFPLADTGYPDERTFLLIYKEHWTELYRKAQQSMYALFTTPQQQWIDHIFTEFLSNGSNFQFKPCLTHGDFDTSNILVNPQSGEITGIIDFEEARLYDPAADLLFFDAGSAFLDKILHNYSAHQVDGPFRNRMKFLYARTCLAYIEWGMDNKRPELVEAGMKIMEKNMKKFPLQ